MIAPEEVMLVLLAAGRSRRYGDVGSKLDAEFLGRPLGFHVAVALEAVPFAERIAVIGAGSLDYATHGFGVIRNDDPVGDMASSVRLGVAQAEARGARAVLLALADMPRVTAAHIYRLMDAFAGDDTVVASSDGRDTKPPALFGRGQFGFLRELHGDQGARELVAGGRHVVTAPAELIDVDTPEELEQLRGLVHDPAAHTRLPARPRGRLQPSEF